MYLHGGGASKDLEGSATATSVKLPDCAAECSVRIAVTIRHVRCFAAGGDDGKPTGAVGWLSAKMSKQISRMGALHEVKKAADKGDVQAMTLMGVCYAMP